MFGEIFDPAGQFSAFIQIVIIDIVLSADNAIIIGMAAAGLPPELRKKAILWGIIGATLLRVFFTMIVFILLDIPGIKVIGGLLLLWVCWRMWQEIRSGETVDEVEAVVEGDNNIEPPKTLRTALINIIVADATMSLDNVLAVAGAAGDHIEILVFGLVLSIALMAAAANYIAKLLEKHNWLGYIGLAVIGFVGIRMTWQGSSEVYPIVSALV